MGFGSADGNTHFEEVNLVAIYGVILNFIFYKAECLFHRVTKLFSTNE